MDEPDKMWCESRHGEILLRPGLVIDNYRLVIIIEEKKQSLCLAPIGCGADDSDFHIDDIDSWLGCEM